MKKISQKLTDVKDWIIKSPLTIKIILLVIVLGISWFGYSSIVSTSSKKPQYQTAQVTRDTLVVSVTASGQVSTANNATISTQASGVISKLYVKDGDVVQTGDKVAEIDLDLPGQQNAAQSLASYQSAKNSLSNAQTNMYTLQSSMFSKWNSFFNLATNGTYQNGDGSPNSSNRTLPEFTTTQDDWLAAEAQYKNQQNVVAQAQTSLNSTWLSYQQTSPIIYAPISGTVSGLSLQVGSVIATTQNSSTTSNSTQSSTKIASVKTQAMPTISVNLTEVDIPKIKIGNKVTITFDAFPNKSFTGKVISIDTAGTVSSGVTNYPTAILLDSDPGYLLPNMGATANIITEVKDNTLLVPSSAVQTQNSSTFVRVLKNGVMQQVTVEVGSSSSSETEIVSGLSEGDTVVTSISTTTQTSTQTATSPFGALGGGTRGGGFSGGGVTRGVTGR